ncbi:MAG: toxic anion resistance protein [Magnetococcales bacterium]|nr:toxic anion resistance protein [Magnetococcales bacterium]
MDNLPSVTTSTPDSLADQPTALAPNAPSQGSLAVPGAGAVQTPETIVPVRPDFLDTAQDERLHQEAHQLVQAILKNPSDIAITTELYALGKPAMDANTRQVSLMDTKIGPVMQTINVENPVAKGLMEIKAQLDLVNPHVVAATEGKFEGKVFGFIKRTVMRLPKKEEVMVLINERRDTVASTIDALKRHLWTERDKALHNATELGMIANHLFSTQEALQTAIYQGQLVWQQLNQARTLESDPLRNQALTYLTNDLSTLVIDLQTVDQLNIQSRMGAENLINNCRQVQKLVGRVTNILLPSVQNALAVKAAAAQQAQLVSSAAQIMDAASSTIRQTAEQVRQTTVATARMNAEGMIRIDDLEAACKEYEMAQSELLDIFENAEQNARGISNTMSDLNSRMRRHADPHTLARQAKESAGV